jgi:hypothetical protein
MDYNTLVEKYGLPELSFGGSTTKPQSPSYLGRNYDFLQNLLKQRVSEGSSNKKQLLDFNKQAIEKSIGASREAIAEDFAGRGTFGSAGMAGINAKLAGEKALALGQSAQQINLMDENVKSNAIGMLLGLNQFEGQTDFRQDQFEYQKEFDEKRFREQIRQFELQLEEAGYGWGDFFGDLLGGAAKVGSAALLAPAFSDIRVKENIEVVGKTSEGIPLVEFNYIGGSKRLKGVIAQDVESFIPEAVVVRNGIKCVDYSKLSVDMAEA